MKQFFIAHQSYHCGRRRSRRRRFRVVVCRFECGARGWFVYRGAGNVVAALDEPGTVAAENKADLSFQEAARSPMCT